MITMYTTTWCGYCRRLKHSLAGTGIEVTEVDMERTPGAVEIVMAANGGNQTVPTLVFEDGSALTNPSVKDIQARLDELAAAGR